jgi:DNA-binding CsgD family transcriptional regulator
MMEKTKGALRGETGVAWNSRPRTDPNCPAATHGTQSAWKKNRCRCPEAVAAHEAALALKRGAASPKPATVVALRPDCPSDKHDNQAAYAAGCRCPLAVQRHARRLEVQRLTRLKRKETEDPYSVQKWRGPQTRVSRVNVLLLTTGFSDSPTTRERQLAIETLYRRGNRYETGFLTAGEIAVRLGITESYVLALRADYRKLASERTARRIADVRAKAARVARALQKETNR